MRMIKRWMKNNKRKLSCACLHYWRCQKASCSCDSPQAKSNEISYELFKVNNSVVAVKGADTISITFSENEGEYSAVIQYNMGDEIEVENANELYDSISNETSAETVWNVLYPLI